MATQEKCPCCGQIVCEEDHFDDWSDDFVDDELDQMDYEERVFEEKCELASNCTCGAWQFNSKNQPVHVADCCCGAE